MTTPYPFHGTGAPDDPEELDHWLDENFPSGSGSGSGTGTGTATSTPDVGSGTPDVATGTGKPG